MDIKDRCELVIRGKDTFKNENGTIEPINWLGLIHTKKYSMRSNHYHPVQEQKVLIIEGKYLTISKDLDNPNSELKMIIVKGGDLVITPPNVVHTHIFLEDTISINLVNGDRDNDNFDKHTIKYELVSEKEKNEYIEKYK